MGKATQTAVVDPVRYSAVASAPRGLRRVMKAGEIERALHAVGEWKSVEAQVDQLRISMVDDLRGRGASWDTIGWLLGTTGGAARQRFGGRQ